MVSKKSRLAALLRKKNANSIPNRIIDVITVSFGLQNIAPVSLASGGDIMTRLKTFVNEIGGRTTGLNLFSDAPKFQQQFSIEGALTNQQTISGVIALAYNELSKRVKILPLKAESRKFAKKNIAVGIGTGLFNSNPIRFGIFSGNQSSNAAIVNVQSSNIPVGSA